MRKWKSSIVIGLLSLVSMSGYAQGAEISTVKLETWKKCEAALYVCADLVDRQKEHIHELSQELEAAKKNESKIVLSAVGGLVVGLLTGVFITK